MFLLIHVGLINYHAVYFIDLIIHYPFSTYLETVLSFFPASTFSCYLANVSESPGVHIFVLFCLCTISLGNTISSASRSFYVLLSLKPCPYLYCCPEFPVHISICLSTRHHHLRVMDRRCSKLNSWSFSISLLLLLSVINGSAT